MKIETGNWMFSNAIWALCNAGKGIKKVTLYITPREVIHATWRVKPSYRNRQEEILVTFGAPNYEDKKRIKSRVKGGVEFPFVHVTSYPIKKK